MRSVVEIGANVPAFLAKLWKLVDDPDTDNLISWSPGGQMFSIQNQADFARELLPLYYKHNNMASFIRQLNMYGFHKVTSVDNGGLKSEKDEIEFCHPCFLRNHPFLLEHIKRKIANPKPISSFGEEKPPLRPEIMNKVLVDVKQMKGKQESLDARFSVMKHENEALWREIALLRQKHIKQQQIVNNLIQFLMSLVQPSRNGPLKSGAKRRYQLMINNAAHNHDPGRDSKSPRLEPDPDYELDENDVDFEDAENGPTIHEVAEQEHLSDAAGHSARLCADMEACPSASPAVSYTSPSPAFSHSSVNENLVMTEEIEDPALQNIPIEFDTILTSEVPLDVECEPLLPEELFVNKRKHSKSQHSGKHSKKACEEVISPTKVVPACTITSSQPTPTLPTNIFDSDETSSQDGAAVSLSDVNQQAAISALQNASDILFEDNITDDVDYLTTLASGSYNPNINLNIAATPQKAPKSSKEKIQEKNLIKNIKEEIMSPEEEDWSNMSLATVSNNDQKRPALNRFQSVSLKEFATLCPGRKSKKPPGPSFPKEEVDDHLDAMQTDLESLRELIRGDAYSFDANTLLGLFSQQEEPFYNLPPMNPAEITLDKSKEAAEDSASQLISYVPPPNLFDFGDIQLDSDSGPGDWQANSEKNPYPSLDDSSPLNTPQVQLSAPDFNQK